MVVDSPKIRSRLRQAKLRTMMVEALQAINAAAQYGQSEDERAREATDMAVRGNRFVTQGEMLDEMNAESAYTEVKELIDERINEIVTNQTVIDLQNRYLRQRYTGWYEKHKDLLNKLYTQIKVEEENWFHQLDSAVDTVITALMGLGTRVKASKKDLKANWKDFEKRIMDSLVSAARSRNQAQDEVIKKNLHKLLTYANHVKGLHDGLAASLPLLGYTDTASTYLKDDVVRLDDILSKIVELESPVAGLSESGSTATQLSKMRKSAWHSMLNDIGNWDESQKASLLSHMQAAAEKVERKVNENTLVWEQFNPVEMMDNMQSDVKAEQRVLAKVGKKAKKMMADATKYNDKIPDKLSNLQDTYQTIPDEEYKTINEWKKRLEEDHQEMRKVMLENVKRGQDKARGYRGPVAMARRYAGKEILKMRRSSRKAEYPIKSSLAYLKSLTTEKLDKFRKAAEMTHETLDQFSKAQFPADKAGVAEPLEKLQEASVRDRADALKVVDVYDPDKIISVHHKALRTFEEERANNTKELAELRETFPPLMAAVEADATKQREKVAIGTRKFDERVKKAFRTLRTAAKNQESSIDGGLEDLRATTLDIDKLANTIDEKLSQTAIEEPLTRLVTHVNASISEQAAAAYGLGRKQLLALGKATVRAAGALQAHLEAALAPDKLAALEALQASSAPPGMEDLVNRVAAFKEQVAAARADALSSSNAARAGVAGEAKLLAGQPADLAALVQTEAQRAAAKFDALAKPHVDAGHAALYDVDQRLDAMRAQLQALKEGHVGVEKPELRGAVTAASKAAAALARDGELDGEVLKALGALSGVVMERSDLQAAERTELLKHLSDATKTPQLESAQLAADRLGTQLATAMAGAVPEAPPSDPPSELPAAAKRAELALGRVLGLQEPGDGLAHVESAEEAAAAVALRPQRELLRTYQTAIGEADKLADIATGVLRTGDGVDLPDASTEHALAVLKPAEAAAAGAATAAAAAADGLDNTTGLNLEALLGNVAATERAGVAAAAEGAGRLAHLLDEDDQAVLNETDRSTGKIVHGLRGVVDGLPALKQIFLRQDSARRTLEAHLRAAKDLVNSQADKAAAAVDAAAAAEGQIGGLAGVHADRPSWQPAGAAHLGDPAQQAQEDLAEVESQRAKNAAALGEARTTARQMMAHDLKVAAPQRDAVGKAERTEAGVVQSGVTRLRSQAGDAVPEALKRSTAAEAAIAAAEQEADVLTSGLARLQATLDTEPLDAQADSSGAEVTVSELREMLASKGMLKPKLPAESSSLEQRSASIDRGLKALQTAVTP